MNLSLVFPVSRAKSSGQATYMVRGLRRALEDLLAFHLDKKNEGLWVYNMLLEADNLIDLEYICAQVEVRLNYY